VRSVGAKVTLAPLTAARQEEPMELIPLGAGGPQVSRAGLGLNSMSGVYGPADEAESIATIRAALDAGITLLDTADFYGMGHNELLLREALRGRDRGSAFIQVKFGGQRDPAGAFVGFDASPAAVKNSLAYTLTRLGTDYVDLYQPARLDPRVRSRTPSVPSPRWFRPAMSATWACQRWALPPSGARTPCIRSARCRSSTR
jgi:aryl-alcohol dehydrogenase-like predicted oxidoreductase